MTEPSIPPIRTPKVQLKDTGTAKGRGMYAEVDFAAGETVEIAPVILLTMHFFTLPPEVQRIVFNWGTLANTDAAHALVLGYGSLYNHDNPANMRYQADIPNHAIRFVAVRDIKAGEELTINYNAYLGASAAEDNNWFERLNVKPITST